MRKYEKGKKWGKVLGNVEHFRSRLQGEQHQIGCNPLGSRAAETKKRNIKLPKTRMQKRPRKRWKMAKRGGYRRTGGILHTSLSLLISKTIDRVATSFHQTYCMCVYICKGNLKVQWGRSNIYTFNIGNLPKFVGPKNMLVLPFILFASLIARGWKIRNINAQNAGRQLRMTSCPTSASESLSPPSAFWPSSTTRLSWLPDPPSFTRCSPPTTTTTTAR